MSPRRSRALPFENQLNVTVPVGVAEPTPVTVAWSCTTVPAGTDVTLCARVVDRPSPSSTRSWSPSTAHTDPVEPLYVPSPEYVAWNAKLPDTFGADVNRVASATPPKRDRRRRRRRGAVTLPFKNQLNVTVPVGIADEPVTVAWSCTDRACRHRRHHLCATALWISVAVLEPIFVTVNGSHAPVEPL